MAASPQIRRSGRASGSSTDWWLSECPRLDTQADEPVLEEVDRVAEALERRGRRVVDLSPPLDRRKVGRTGRPRDGRPRGARPDPRGPWPAATVLADVVVVEMGHHHERHVGRVHATRPDLRGDAALGDPVLHRHLPEDDAERSRGIDATDGSHGRRRPGRAPRSGARRGTPAPYHCAGRVNDPSSVRRPPGPRRGNAGAR